MTPLHSAVIFVAMLNHSWPHVLLLASGFLIAPVFALILRSVEKQVSNLLVDLLTTRSLLSFHLTGLTHSILDPGGGESTCFLLSKDGLGILTEPSFNQPTPRCLCFPTELPASPASLYLWLRAWGGGKSSLRWTDAPDTQQATF